MKQKCLQMNFRASPVAGVALAATREVAEWPPRWRESRPRACIRTSWGARPRPRSLGLAGSCPGPYDAHVGEELFLWDAIGLASEPGVGGGFCVCRLHSAFPKTLVPVRCPLSVHCGHHGTGR